VLSRVSRPLAAAAALAAVVAAALPAWALSVTVDGSPVVFNPPPIVQAGRVFVPLRGVFERLGASVVYAHGVINATSDGHEISLTIGSLRATVDNAPQRLDQAPFIIGASTYVPLRFVSEALGAEVNFDAANQLVALNTNRGGGPPAGPPPVAHAFLRDLEPPRGATVGSRRPTISATFVEPVDPNSLRLTLDGLDITRDATRSPSGFIFAPPSPLQSIVHVVQVTGTLASGGPFTGTWRFTTGQEAPRNLLQIISPPDGSGVGRNFTIVGRTLPNALIHIDAGASANFAGRSFAFGSGNFAADTTADGAGNFSQNINVQSFPGAAIGVTITSTDPRTRESAQKKLQLQTN
jgi:hypothetical protein